MGHKTKKMFATLQNFPGLSTSYGINRPKLTQYMAECRWKDVNVKTKIPYGLRFYTKIPILYALLTINWIISKSVDPNEGFEGSRHPGVE